MGESKTADVIKLPERAERPVAAERCSPGTVHCMRKREPCPPGLEWFLSVVEHQKTKEFRGHMAYRKALARQQAERIIAKKKRTT